MVNELTGIDRLFRKETSSNTASTKRWADGYIAAFAMAAGMRLVMLDKAQAGKVKGSVVVG